MKTSPELEALTAELESAAAQSRALNEQWRELNSRRDVLVGEQVDQMTDADFLGDETALRWLLREAFSNRVAHNRVRALAKTDAAELSTDSIDGRDEYINDSLPALRVALKHGQDVTHVAEAIREWAQTWALGRDTLSISILERTLSEHGSWSIRYDVAADSAEVGVTRWHNHSAETAGTLEDALRYVATNCWYEES